MVRKEKDKIQIPEDKATAALNACLHLNKKKTEDVFFESLLYFVNNHLQQIDPELYKLCHKQIPGPQSLFRAMGLRQPMYVATGNGNQYISNILDYYIDKFEKEYPELAVLHNKEKLPSNDSDNNVSADYHDGSLKHTPSKKQEHKYYHLMGEKPLFGREEDVKAIRGIFWEKKAALVTLVGPGGSGKSVLANKVAHVDFEQLKNGAVFIELAPLRSDRMIIPAIFEMLEGIQLGFKGDTLEQLVNALREMEILIILDNCEYLATRCGEIASAIITSCPKVKILATSQTALGTPSEVEYQVKSLKRPKESDDINEMLNSPSVQLFMHQAAISEPTFKLSEKTKNFVREICVRGSGVPLYIILAASSMSYHSVRDIAKGLAAAGNDDNPENIYFDSPKDTHPAHGSIESAIQWSVGLLEKSESDLFLKLSVFPDDFTADAAVAISGSQPITAQRSLQRLRSVSLLTGGTNKNDEKTFLLLESIRLFSKKSAKRLLPDWENTKSLFVSYCFALCQGFVKGFFTPEQEKWLNRIDCHYNNIIEALKILEERGDLKRKAEMISNLWRYWEVKARFQEGTQRIDLILKDATDLGETYLELLHGISMLYYRGGDNESANALFERHRKASSQYIDYEFGKRNLAQALTNISNSLSATAPEKAKAYLFEARNVFESYGDYRMIAVCLNNLGNFYLYSGNLKESKNHYQQSLERFKKDGNEWESGYPLFGLGVVYFQLEDYKRAKKYLLEAYEKSKQAGDNRNIGKCECYLAILGLQEQDRVETVKRLKAASTLLVQTGDKLTLSEFHIAIILLALQIGLENEAINLFSFMLEMEKVHLPRMQYLFRLCKKKIEEVKIKIGNVLYREQFKLGTLLNEEEVAEIVSFVLSKGETLI